MLQKRTVCAEKEDRDHHTNEALRLAGFHHLDLDLDLDDRSAAAPKDGPCRQCEMGKVRNVRWLAEKAYDKSKSRIIAVAAESFV